MIPVPHPPNLVSLVRKIQQTFEAKPQGIARDEPAIAERELVEQLPIAAIQTKPDSRNVESRLERYPVN